MKTQYDAIGALLKRKKGATAADLIAATMSTSIHKRMSEMRERGWRIKREAIEGKTYGRYFGCPPDHAANANFF
jgi:hypothetical protein